MTPHDRRARAYVRTAGAAALVPLLLLTACMPRGVEPARMSPPRLLGTPVEEPAAPRRDRIFFADRSAAATETAEIAEVAEVALAPGASLAIPVRGIRPEQLRDSYHDARSGGRVHNAIDIMAPRGTPVIAAADGTVRKLRTGGNGGITIYQVGTDGRTMYYYAHLERYAAGLREGLPIVRGQVIAYVGDTGNAGPGNYHLHFSVGRLSDPSRYWDSENMNPYPLLAGYAAHRAASR